MSWDIAVQIIVAASAVIQAVYGVCELIRLMNKKR